MHSLLRLLCLMIPLFFGVGCATSYDCALQAPDDAMSFDACRQMKGTPVFRFCTDNPRYKSFAECAKDATKPGSELCLARKARRPEVYECLQGKGGSLVDAKDKERLQAMPKLVLVEDPKPTSQGTGPFVTGIVLTAAGPAMGLLLASYAKSLDCTKEEDEDKKEECETVKDNGPQAGVFYAGLGIGVGVPLLLHGISQRRAYREWHERHPNESAALKLDFMPLRRGGLAAALTYQFEP